MILDPSIDERCEIVWDKYWYMMRQREVTRMGFVKLGFYNRFVPKVLDPDEPMNDAEHIFECLNLTMLVKDFFGDLWPEMFGYAPDWLGIYDQMLMHELGEAEIGDLTDDGSYDAFVKDAQEDELNQKFLTDFPENVRKIHRAQFTEFQGNRCLGRCIDKAVFVLDQGIFKSYGIEGNMNCKALNHTLTERDLFYAQAAGSDRPVDAIYVHFLDVTRGLPWRFIFTGIIEAMYRAEYGENGEPGKVPEALKAFY